MTFHNPMAVASAALVLIVGLSGCGERSAETANSHQQQHNEAGFTVVHGAGATFPAPLYAKWMERYKSEQPEVEFSYDAIGSGGGIKRFMAGDVDFGASDAAMSDAEMAKVERGAVVVPMTAGMVVLAYNLPGIEGELKLSREAYVGIFNGDITHWNDERIARDNPDLDLGKHRIAIVVRRDGSGTTYAFTNHLSAISEPWRDNGPGTGKQIDWPGAAMTALGNEGVAQRVKISDWSIGYMEYGFARRIGLPMAALQNRDGRFIQPSAATGAAALGSAEALTQVSDSHAEAQVPEDLRLFLPDPKGEASYPIVSLSWILLYQRYADADIATALKDALAWGLGDQGQGIAEQMGYIPLPENLARAADATLDGVR